jgi:hypothetical protein
VQVKTKAGLALVAMGMCVFAAWKWWVGTRHLVPLDLPMPLTADEGVTRQFKLNYDGLYLIEITAEPTIALDTLHCLMGVEAEAARCKEVPSAIAANWVVSRDGREVRRGSSIELHSAPAQSQTVTRVIGEFPGKAGETYNLRVTSTTDAEPLSAANPRLRVAVASIAYTDLESAGVLAFAAAFICVLFGGVLLGIAWFAGKQDRVWQ